jgi:hypothetical protein
VGWPVDVAIVVVVVTYLAAVQNVLARRQTDYARADASCQSAPKRQVPQ